MPSADKFNVVACIPAFNEERAIAGVLLKVRKYVAKIIVCDDGSSDLTADISESMGATVVRHQRNQGYGSALASLFEAARKTDGEIFVIIDGDGQHNASDIPKLCNPVSRGEADIVIGSRFLDKETDSSAPEYRKAGIRLITSLTNKMSKTNLTDSQSGFRAYSRKAIENIQPTEMGMGASTEILMKGISQGFVVGEVPIVISYEGEKTSTHNPVYHGIAVVLSSFKTWSIQHPLVVYGIPGISLLIVSLVFLIWTLSEYTVRRVIITNLALISVGCGVVGVMLTITAILLWVLISIVRER